MDQGSQGQGKFPSMEISCKSVTVTSGSRICFHANLKLLPQYKGKVKQLSSFYREVVYAWETLSSGGDINPDCKEMILSQSSWNNSLIVTSDSRSLFNDSLFKKGVAFVNDLIDDLSNVKFLESSVN